MGLKEDWNKFKSVKGFKAKLVYIKSYYTIPIVIIAIVLGLLINFIVGRINKVTPICYVVMVNTDSFYVDTDDEMLGELLQADGYSMKRKSVDISKNYSYGLEDNAEQDVYTQQALAALFMIGEIDVFMADEETYEFFAKQDIFADLSELIDSSILDQYDLYTYTDSEGNETIAGVILHDDSKVHEAGYYHGDVIMGLAYTANNFDTGKDLIIQILSK